MNRAQRLFDTYAPEAILSVEKNGPNAEGKYCVVGVNDKSDCVIKTAEFLHKAERRRTRIDRTHGKKIAIR